MSKLVLLRHGQSQWNLENKFTGWVDVPLTAQGEAEAKNAGIKIKHISFDIAFTSLLQRAQKTLKLALSESNQTQIPTEKDEALNERHYGDLQGMDKAETAKKYSPEQVKIWRRSYDVPPPGEKGESLKDTAARTLPYFESRIMTEVKSGKNVIVAAHGNSLRSIVMNLDKLTKEQVLELNIDTGVPIIYDINAEGKVLSKQILN